MNRQNLSIVNLYPVEVFNNEYFDSVSQIKIPNVILFPVKIYACYLYIYIYLNMTARVDPAGRNSRALS